MALPPRRQPVRPLRSGWAGDQEPKPSKGKADKPPAKKTAKAAKKSGKS